MKKILTCIGLFILIFSLSACSNKKEEEKEDTPRETIEVPLVIDYNDEAYILEDIPEKIKVTLIGTKKKIAKEKEHEHVIKLDLTEKEAGKYKVKLNFETYEDIDYELEYQKLEVYLKTLVSDKKELKYEIVNEDELDSVPDVKTDYAEVVVRGSKEKVEQVDCVKVFIEVTGNTFTSSIKVLNKEGKEVSGISFFPNTIGISLYWPNIIKKEIVIKNITVKNLKEGFVANKITENGVKATLKGSEELLKKLNESDIFAYIDLSNVDKEGEYEVNLQIEKLKGITFEYNDKLKIRVTKK